MNRQVLDARRDLSGGYKVDVTRGERDGRVSSEWFSRPDDPTLQPGDQVFVLDDAMVTIVHADGCEYKLIRNHVSEIGESSPCNPSAAMLADQRSRPVTSENANPEAAAPTAAPASRILESVNWATVAATAIIPAATVLVAIAGSTQGSGSHSPPKPLSP
jgi:hypothetical protein